MNILTNSMNRLTRMLSKTDEKLKEMGTTPYRQEKATPKEQIQMYENLTEGKLYELIQEHGIDAVSKWLYKMEQRSKHG